jgi:general secretion pathway protein B
MSLILEALKKSEAKRRLGEAPDLETPFAAQSRRSSPLPLIVAAIVIASGVGWWLLRTPAAPSGAVSTPAQEKPLATTPPPAPVRPTAPKPPVTVSALPAVAPEMTQIKPDVDPALVSQWVPVGQGSLHMPGGKRKRAAEAAAANPAEALHAPAAVQKKPLVVVTPTSAPNTVVTVAPPPGVKNPEPAPVARLEKPEQPSVAASGAGVKKPEPPPEPALASGMKKPEPAPQAALAAGTKKPELAAAAAPDSSAQPYYELPFSVRKELPSLKLSMHVYAAEPAQRFIILNDSRMVEGNSQEDLALREIRPDGAVFEFKGQRFFYPRDGL